MLVSRKRAAEIPRLDGFAEHAFVEMVVERDRQRRNLLQLIVIDNNLLVGLPDVKNCDAFIPHAYLLASMPNRAPAFSVA